MTTESAKLVDIADPPTWPAEVSDLVDELVDEVRATDGFHPEIPACDLPSLVGYNAEFEGRLRERLGEHGIAMYHGTRLLPHELEELRVTGLQPLSQGLRSRRVRGAHQHHSDLLTADDAEFLLANGPLRWQGSAVRLGLLFLVAPLAVVADDGMSRLISTWGGESLYWHDETADGLRCQEAIKRLTAVSIPSVVCVGPRASDLSDLKDLWPQFVGVRSNLEHGNEWTTHSSVTHLNIVDVLQPGHLLWRFEWT